jgi:mannose-1-phosphate guanylyltransferase/phosphomannomutase
MVPILNRPIAEHIVNLLKRNGITEVIATLHYLPDVMRNYFSDGRDFGIQMTYAVEEDQPLGTAGCVKNIADLLTDTFLVISGDSVTDFDLKSAIEFHRQKGSKATLVLTRVPNPIEFGVVIADNEGRIQRFLEKPSTSEIFSDTVNTGTYILEPDVLDYLPPNEESDFSKDLFPLLLEKGEPLYGYVADGYWCDVGHLEAYREAQYDALHRKVVVDYAYRETSPDVWIGDNTQIDSTVQINPPVMIGNNCRIGARTVLEPGTVIGDNVTIGCDADLKRPIVWNGAIVGDEVHLRACTIARGARVDRRSHVLEGAVIGPLSTVGEEAQISPGVRVWPSKQIESGATLNINLIWGNTAQRNLFGQRGGGWACQYRHYPRVCRQAGGSLWVYPQARLPRDCVAGSAQHFAHGVAIADRGPDVRRRQYSEPRGDGHPSGPQRAGPDGGSGGGSRASTPRSPRLRADRVL